MSSLVAYLGPKGTYAEQAADALSELENLPNRKLIPCGCLRSVINEVVNKRCHAGVIPVENSVEGGVTASLDALWVNPEISIRRAIVLPIQHALISNGNLNEISEVLSHPQALAQCSDWLTKHLPNALQLPTSSTAEAVRMSVGSKFRAAIGSRKAAKLQGLHELAFPINDVAGNRTRFLLLQNGHQVQRGDIASIAFSLHANSPGALLDALKCIARLGLNMSRIESRPSKRELGEYVFFVDVELNKNKQTIIQELINKLNPLCENLIHFGTYISTEFTIE